ncbi:MAG: hypothetical protein PHR48_00605 [Candidatus ainarchaeum sp.]|nr:hypothetical protein [Candidatus ainarchaeum sp.]
MFLKNKIIYKNQKGFNLFTALVSLMLISITLVLIFNMVQTEDTYLSLIEDQSSISDLITVSDLARADAFNLFVVGLREQWENFRSSESNEILIGRPLVELSWNDFVDEMILRIFFESNFTGYFTENLLTKLKYSKDPVGYSINVDSPEEEGDLREVIEQMFEDAPTKAEVVNCEQEEDDICVGSFYLYLSAAELSDEHMEKLPKVTIRRFKNNDVIQRPLFDKRIYKIYMPWRGFQAFKSVRRIALTPDGEMSDNPAQDAFNKGGLFDPVIHNSLEQARVGVCDKGSCAPRTNLFETVDVDGFDKTCNDRDYSVSVSSNGIFISESGIDIKLKGNDPYEYKLRDYLSDSKTILDSLVEQTTKNILHKLGKNPSEEKKVVFGDGRLEMLGDIYAPTLPDTKIKINEIDSRNNPSISKYGEEAPQVESPGTNPLTVYKFDPSLSWNNSFGPGLFFNEEDNNSFMPLLNFQSPPTTQVNSQLRCTELDSVKYNFKFKENDVRYKVNDDKEIYIYITLYDDYVSFVPNTENLKLKIKDSLNTGYFILEDPNQPIEENFQILSTEEDNWTCYSYEGGVNQTPGCVPTSSN